MRWKALAEIYTMHSLSSHWTFQFCGLKPFDFRCVFTLFSKMLVHFFDFSFNFHRADPSVTGRRVRRGVEHVELPIRGPLALYAGDPSADLSWKVRSARDRTIRTFQIGVRSAFFQNSEIFARKFNNFGKSKFQHFLKYRRNSDKISSKSEQKSPKRIQK